MTDNARYKFHAAVAIVLQRDDGKILVQQRRGSFADGFYMLPTGHVDGGESMAEAMSRELQEETGLQVDPFALQLFHIAHSAYEKEDELLTFFFFANEWYGKLVNREPDKCAGLYWVDPAKLPAPFLVHAAEAVRAFRRGEDTELVTYPLSPPVNVIDLTRHNHNRRRTKGPTPE